MSDLIDRQAVRLAKVPYDEQLSEYERGWNDACEAIADNVPSAPRWHRVEDQLPEPGQDVLVYTYFYGRSIYAVAWLDNEEKWSFGTVTHWMPLPEPPKEEEHGN